MNSNYFYCDGCLNIFICVCRSLYAHVCEICNEGQIGLMLGCEFSFRGFGKKVWQNFSAYVY